MAGCVSVNASIISNYNKKQQERINQFQTGQKHLLLDAYKQQNEAFGQVLDAYNNRKGTSLNDFNTFLNNQEENFKILSNDQIQELKNIFSKDFQESLNNFYEELPGEMKGVKDEDAVTAVREGKYLPNRVNENILDSYATPNYHLRLFMMDRNWVNKMRNQEMPDEKSTIKYEIELPEEAEKIVVIAETSATDITIDNVDIQHFLSEPVKGKSTSVGTSVGFTLTEPGSVSLLDRLAAAKAFLGYTNINPSETLDANNEAVITGGGQAPFYLEVTFKGYPDDPSGDEPNGKADPEQIGKKFIYELSYLKFNMDITPQGTTYNCTSHLGQDTARFPEYTILKSDIIIEGSTISELLNSLKDRLNVSMNDTVSENNPAKTEYKINYNNMFMPKVAKEDEETGERYDENGNIITYKDTLDYIGDKLFVDPEKVTPVEKANAPDWYETKNDQSIQGMDTPTIYTNYGTINLDPEDSLYASPISAVATGIDTEKYTDKEGANKQKFKTILEEPDRVRINIPSGRTVYDAINSIMSLCYDLMSKATRLVDFEDPSKGVKKDQTHVYWYDIEHFINTDLSDSAYDPLNNNYKSKIEYSVTLIKNARADIGISASELNMSLSAEDITKRLTELNISKEYLYMFTGLNDQIINMELKFDDAYVLSVPYYGMENPQEQLAFALAGDITLDEAQKDGGKNVLLNSPSDNATEQQQKNNILKFINDLKNDSGDLVPEANALIEQLANPNVGFGREFLETALTKKGSREESDLVEAIQKSDSLKQAVNAQLTKNRISANPNSPTSSDASDDPDSENPNAENEENIEETARDIPIWSSQLVPGLEGPGDDPRIARVFGSILDEKINSYISSTTLKTADVIKTKTSTNRQFITQPVERGSVRQTAFAHLMHQHSGAVATQRINIDVRGDPWYWGKSNFLKADAEGVEEYTSDLDGTYYDSGGPHVLLMIEAPRKLDFDTSDEDADINTGLYNMGHLNYTMSGVYLVVESSSNLSDGVFVTSLQLVRQSDYEVSKLERVKEIVANRAEELYRSIDNEGDGVVVQAKEAIESNFNEFNEENGGIGDNEITPNFYSND